MSSFDKSRPPGKSGQRNRKPKQQNKKPDQRQRPKPDQRPDRQQDESELIEAEVASTETFPIEAEASTGASSIEAEVASTETFPIAAEPSTGTSLIRATVASTEPPSKGALVPMDAFPIAAAAPVDIFLIGFQAIANAYREHARRSLEQTLFFVEKFTAVRSLDKAVEIQAEFAKEACETFVADSHKIWRLYGELARQVLRPFERLLTRVTQAAR
jgi:hypothetical protein